jgi:23S rRNA pseudouridine1911/1915/1917 synthase
MNIPILYEDDSVVAVDKPSGLLVHPDGKTDEATLVDWLLERYPEIRDVGEAWESTSGEVILRSGIVHRLDRETSGVLVIAKNQGTFLHLKKQFQSRSIKKIYNAFVYGVLKDDAGVIDRPIGKSAKDFRLWSAQRGSRGVLRDAVTEYAVLKRPTPPGRARGSEATYVEARPKTGRTHQLRVHFKAIHHPVVCDALYAPKQPCILSLTRLALHARSLIFELPSGETVAAEAPLPAEFTRALELL